MPPAPAPAPASSTCPRCSSSLTEIRLEQAGRMMVMRSCSSCDSRWWQRDGQDVDLTAVLTTVASTKRPVAAGRR